MGFVCAGMLWAQTDAPPVNPDAASQASPGAWTYATGSVAGTVYCSDTHRPARGALVMAVRVGQDSDDSAPKMARTGIDGRYMLPHVPAGEYLVIAYQPGYLMPTNGAVATALGTGGAAAVSDDPKRRTVSVGDGPVRFDIQLDRGATVSGRVMYSDGSPDAQAKVELWSADAQPSGRYEANEPAHNYAQRMGIDSGISIDDQGRYWIAGVVPGKYRVVVRQTLMGDAEGANGSVDLRWPGASAAALRVYAGDTLHEKDAKVFELKAGEETPGVDITVPLDAFHRLSGTVSAADGRTINMGEVTLKDANDASVWFHTQIDRDGTFVFANVPAGTYTLMTRSARIVEPTADPAGYVWASVPSRTLNSFDDTETTVTMKESDMDGVTVSVNETLAPAAADKTQPAAPSAAQP